MEPVLPTSGCGELAELSVEIFRKSGELAATLPSKAVRAGVATLVREMNSYYSNLIEGHKTLPREMEKALREDFPDREEDRRPSHHPPRPRRGADLLVQRERAAAHRLPAQGVKRLVPPAFYRFTGRW